MKKRFQIKRFKFRHLFLLLTLLTFVGCVKNDLVQKDDYEAISIDDAKDAYEIRLSNSRQKSKTITDRRITDLGKYKLDWDNAVEHHANKSSWIDVPISNQETEYKAQRLYEDNGNLLHYDVKISQRLVVIYKDKGVKHTPSAYILSIIPDKLYSQKHPDDLNSIYSVEDKHDYTGFALYHTLSGDLVSVHRYIDGVLRFYAFLPHNDEAKRKRNIERVDYALALMRVYAVNESNPLSKSEINKCPTCGKPWYTTNITGEWDPNMCSCGVDIYGNYTDYGYSYGGGGAGGNGEAEDESDWNENNEGNQNREEMNDGDCPDECDGGLSGGGSSGGGYTVIKEMSNLLIKAMNSIGVTNQTLSKAQIRYTFWNDEQLGYTKIGKGINNGTHTYEIEIRISPRIKNNSELMKCILFHEALHIKIFEWIEGISVVPNEISGHFNDYVTNRGNSTNNEFINNQEHELMFHITDYTINLLNAFNPNGLNNNYTIYSGGLVNIDSFKDAKDIPKELINAYITNMENRDLAPIE